MTSLTRIISMSLITRRSALSILRSHAFMHNKSTHTHETGFILPYALGKLFDSSESCLIHIFSKKTYSHIIFLLLACILAIALISVYSKFILQSFKSKIKNLGFRKKAFQNKRENPTIFAALNPCHQHV